MAARALGTRFYFGSRVTRVKASTKNIPDGGKSADLIVSSLEAVACERFLRELDAGFAARVQALKQYQQRRFERSYADLLQEPRHAPAARFFLEELYGPKDFALRDAQFKRVVPALARMFPAEIVQTVGTLAELHALSEALDSEMARQLPSEQIAAADYVRAWQATGRSSSREQQIALTLGVGEALDRYTKLPMLGTTLRMMRGPARAAGMEELQQFLEAGFAAFKAMRGAEEFLGRIAQREAALFVALFEPDAVAAAMALDRAGNDSALAHLP